VTDTIGQLALLHVSHGYRRLGIGSRLCKDVEMLARLLGAAHLYVSAMASESAVGFYRSRGFDVANDPDPDFFRLEPDDIHMILTLPATPL
jgi:ribosomal protein S18 acetylase RimI-like enzyme